MIRFVLMVSCLILMLGCATTTSDVEGVYSVALTRAGGDCTQDAPKTSNETVTIMENGDSEVEILFSGLKGSCSAPFKNGKVTASCHITRDGKYVTVQASWEFDGDSFSGTTTLAGACSLVYSTSGKKQ